MTTLDRTRPALALAALLFPLAHAVAVDPPHVADCGACHVTHNGTVVDSTENFCRSCHFAGGPGTEMRNHVGAAATVAVTCTDCHDPHAQQPGVGKYLRSVVKTPAGPVEVALRSAGDYHLCVACHAQPVGAQVPVDWTASKHGLVAADPLLTLGAVTGFPLAAPFEDSQRGSYVVDCVACHGPHSGDLLRSLVRPTVNGSTVSVLGDGRLDLRSLCNSCHVASPDRHHVEDVAGKMGTTPNACTTCHPMLWDPVSNSMYFDMNNCLTSSCHNHGEFF